MLLLGLSNMSRPPRFVVSVTEILVAVAILSTLWAILLPAVNAAREVPRPGIRDALPPLLPELQTFCEHNPRLFVLGTPIVATAFAAAVLAIGRGLAPKRIRDYFPWTAFRRSRGPFLRL